MTTVITGVWEIFRKSHMIDTEEGTLHSEGDPEGTFIIIYLYFDMKKGDVIVVPL